VRGFLLLALAGMLSVAIAGCSDSMSSMNRFFNPGAQTSPESEQVPITAAPPGSVASPSAAEASPQAQSTPHPSHTKASNANRSKAALASKQPAQTTDSPVTDSPEVPKPVVTLAEPADGPAVSASAQTPTPSGQVSASTSVASITPGAAMHDKAQALIREVNGDAKQVDEKNLTPDQIRSESLALGLIHGAEKSFDDGDYSASDSLAEKASALLKALPMVETPSSNNK
jgi:hypothetical protein